jgi:lipopolysaccharide/colanic/teichoic acid biosynthesis glycosyltransferase
MKRWIDLGGAVCGLVLLVPVFVVVAVLIKVDGGGPVFFRQVRVGRGGMRFRIWKFRTMVVDAEQMGGSLTASADPRVTGIGHWLRKYKLDELPQLLNVLCGNMSLVGPRPEVPEYVALYDGEQRKVLDLYPGITDPASLKYFNEGALLAKANDADRTYREEIMPDKIKLNLQHAQVASRWRDLVIVVRTVKRMIGGAR